MYDNQVGSYKRIKEFKNESSASVSLVHTPNRPGRFILKIMKKNHPLSKQLINEAEKLITMDTPAIPSFYHIDIDKSTGWVETLQEYKEGSTLSSFMKDASSDELLQICRTLCKILHDLHCRDRPIVHRDLSPSNIIVYSPKEVSLIDFGISVFEEEDAFPIGTEGFAAPEQYVRSQGDVRTDLYGFGALLCYLNDKRLKNPEIHAWSKRLTSPIEARSVSLCEIEADLHRIQKKGGEGLWKSLFSFNKTKRIDS
ncbi:MULTISPECIES: serine/threonine protein kinase [Pontibacillus]|uniref:Protein kinase n=1 Tax=Pontibacillus chungwhensis TaxID=265426 RepID=A0ABY8USV6_9BACI|nr:MULTISPECIES: protein kinase [Pontibacillus]MCD5323125.1 protein kinase [Pontibacillus sp. HN14]WIF96513.1 protein kinase [Pontibacillus chungwhensis]